jgi:uncharacterized protein
MTATAGTTTIELPIPVRERLARLKAHARQPYHEVIVRALEALEGRTGLPGLDPMVERHRRALRKVARRHGIDRLWLFGSRAKGLARPDSDVDLLYHAPPQTNLWDVSGFMADAEDILGRKVDLLDIDHVPDRLRHVVAEAIPL